MHAFGAAELDEVPDCDPADFTLATMPARFKQIGDRHAGIDEHAGSIEPLLELFETPGLAMRHGRLTTRESNLHGKSRR
jgi:hypothetical protein